MTQDRNSIEEVSVTEAGSGTAGKPPGRWLVVARTVAAITLPFTLATAFFFILLAGMGRHGSGPGNVMVLVAAAIAFLPLALFAPIRWTSRKFWHVAGALALAINLIVVLPTGYDVYRQVSYVPPERKEADAKLLAVHLLGNQSELISDADAPWGIRTRLTFRVDRDIPLDRDGELPLWLMIPPNLYVNAVGGGMAGSILPLTGVERNLQVSLNGVAQDTQALWRLLHAAHGAGSTPVGMLHAGEYVIEFDNWFAPVSTVSDPMVRCIGWKPGMREQMEKMHGSELTIQFKKHVVGKVKLESQPVRVQYDHEGWIRQLSSLGLPECGSLK